MGESVDKELERLYGLPLDEFTPARNALARDLRKAGDREAADRVKALRKPSLSAWAVNQLARQERLQMRSLLTAGDRLRKAQDELLRGAGPDKLQKAFEQQREAVAALVESAAEVLRSAGHPTTDATLDRVRGTLTSAAGDEEVERLVRDGRMTEDVDPTGFGPALPGLAAGRKRPARAERASAPVRAKGRRDADAARKKRIERAKQEVDGLRAELSERKADARRATSEARKAERAAKAANDAAEKAEKELAELTERLEAAKDALDKARSA
jgi:hypothetical protein